MPGWFGSFFQEEKKASFAGDNIPVEEKKFFRVDDIYAPEEKKERYFKVKFDPQNPTYSVANDFISNPSGVVDQAAVTGQVIALALSENLLGTNINGDIFMFQFDTPLSDTDLNLLLGVVQSYTSTPVVSNIISVNVAEIQALGTNAGTFTGGAWQTRVLNAISDTTANWLFFDDVNYIVTLVPGIYDFVLQAPANSVGANQLRVYNNTTDAPEDGLIPNNAPAGNGNVYSLLVMRVRISVGAGNTAYIVQHLAANTVADIGLGAAANIGTNEKYTSWQINLVVDNATPNQKLALQKLKTAAKQAGRAWRKSN